MCGRFAQISGIADLIDQLNPQLEIDFGYDNLPIGRYNVAPRTKVYLFRYSDKLILDSVIWGWKPEWARDMQPPINARVESVFTSKFFKQIASQRCLIPANGWFEWLKEDDSKQPYYIHAKDNQPLFFAGLGHFKEHSENNGFVIITADSLGGMVDVHDRRPIVFNSEYANKWLLADDMDAPQIALKNSRPSTDFEWYPVNKAVGNVRNQGEYLIEPIKR